MTEHVTDAASADDRGADTPITSRPHAPGATPLDPDELEGLRLGHLRTQGELNAAEALNILQAEAWIAGWQRRRDVLTERFLKTLHQEMFGATWKWAGQYRTTMKNVSPFAAHEVPMRIRDLLANVREERQWCDSAADDGDARLDDIAARFHHQLVYIHPWPNGNGRHARLAADLALASWGRPRFTWGTGNEALAPSERRAAYIRALRLADGHDYAALRAFVRG